MSYTSDDVSSLPEESVKIAVLLTSHNRKDRTLECLESLFASEVQAVEFEVYLVDDSSTDGTAEVVAANYPDVNIAIGSGALFWGGGMRLAFARAAPRRPTFILWLNDDEVLERDAIHRLLNAHRTLNSVRDEQSIIVGSTRDRQTGEVSYGGVQRTSRIRRMNFSLIDSKSEIQPCETMNGNVVLIPRSVYLNVGNIDKKFTHAMGDFDYGLRARRAGCKIFVAPGYFAECDSNSPEGTFRDLTLSRRERLRRAVSTKGIPPREWVSLCRRHAGPLWPIFAMAPYIRLLAELRR